MKYSKPVKIINDHKLCEFDCGNIAKFKQSNGKLICDTHRNKCPINKKKNSESLKLSNTVNNPDYSQRYKNSSESSKIKMNWNKGLSKETDIRVAKNAKTYSDNIKSGKTIVSPWNHTEETKAELSLKRIKYLESCPHINWYPFLDFKVQGLWELNVGNRLIELGFQPTRVKLKYDKTRNYTPDFKLTETEFIEVKGWLKDRDVLKYKKVFESNPEIKIWLIRGNNYKKFIAGEIMLNDCEDLKETINLL